MEGNINIENVVKMQKSKAATVVVNIVLLLEGALFKGKPERCRNIK